jgi:hypothetical protein
VVDSLPSKLETLTSTPIPYHQKRKVRNRLSCEQKHYAQKAPNRRQEESTVMHIQTGLNISRILKNFRNHWLLTCLLGGAGWREAAQVGREEVLPACSSHSQF